MKRREVFGSALGLAAVPVVGWGSVVEAAPAPTNLIQRLLAWARIIEDRLQPYTRLDVKDPIDICWSGVDVTTRHGANDYVRLTVNVWVRGRHYEGEIDWAPSAELGRLLDVRCAQLADAAERHLQKALTTTAYVPMAL